MKSKTISIYIDAPPEAVYEYASNPANLTAWAPAFCASIENVDGKWIVTTPDGPATIAFAKPNPHGVLDHTISFPSDLVFTSYMRVIPNGNGSELLFTLFQQEGISDQQFEEDEALLRSDLETLRRLLERTQR